ncbi:class I SAM-dependent methyltransferase [Streptomyces canus]|uniref:class I SAM-dependent methyltransferase n=1 Tax=Streptomyces canus TaxID=58343 RepID=UPI00367E2661
MTALALRDNELGGILAHYSTHHTSPEQLPLLYAEFHRTLAPSGLLMPAGHAEDDEYLRLRPTQAYGGHPVSYESHLLPAERIAEPLSRAGLVITTRLVQEPDEGARRTVATFLARKPERPLRHSGCHVPESGGVFMSNRPTGQRTWRRRSTP